MSFPPPLSVYFAVQIITEPPFRDTLQALNVSRDRYFGFGDFAAG